MTETGAPYSVDSYTEPTLGTKEEAVRAALKAHRTLSRVRLASKEPSVTGKALPEFTVWLFDMWRLVDSLSPVEKMVVRLYFMTERPDAATYGNREIAAQLGLSERHVARIKRQAVERLVREVRPGEVGS